VAGFYAARDSNMPPLLWPSIAPPFTDNSAMVISSRIAHAQQGDQHVRTVCQISSFRSQAIVEGIANQLGPVDRLRIFKQKTAVLPDY